MKKKKWKIAEKLKSKSKFNRTNSFTWSIINFNDANISDQCNSKRERNPDVNNLHRRNWNVFIDGHRCSSQMCLANLKYVHSNQYCINKPSQIVQIKKTWRSKTNARESEKNVNFNWIRCRLTRTHADNAQCEAAKKATEVIHHHQIRNRQKLNGIAASVNQRQTAANYIINVMQMNCIWSSPKWCGLRAALVPLCSQFSFFFWYHISWMSTFRCTNFHVNNSLLFLNNNCLIRIVSQRAIFTAARKMNKTECTH